MKLCEMNYTVSTCVYEKEQSLEDQEITDPMAVEYRKLQQLIFAKLVNTEKNKSLLETIPHEPMLDLSLVFYM